MSLYSELKRRNVVKVGLAYAAVAWLLIEVTSTIFPILNLPEWTVTSVTVVLLIGFLPALVIAWAFEFTHDGIKFDKDIDRSATAARVSGRKLDFLIITVLALALSVVVIDQYVLEERVTKPVAPDPGDDSLPGERDTTVVKRSIAVLPFRNRSALAEDAHFVDGIHDDITMQLAKISVLDKVISRTSVERYRDTDKPATLIGQELGVSTLLEGGVQRAGERVRINIQLIDAASDEHLWAKSFDRELTTQNIFEIQSEIARKIADSLRLTLSAADHVRLEKVPTGNLDAYDAYLMGKLRIKTRRVSDLEKAAGYFKRAIDIDPEYALAYASLADTYMLLGDYGGMSLNEMLSLAMPAANKALELDDELAEAYTSIGAIRSKAGDYESSEAAYMRAIELDPNYSTAYHWYGDLHVTYLRQPEEAVPLLQRAVFLDPLSTTLNVTLGQAYGGLGEFDKAMALYQRAVEIEPNYPNAYSLIANVHKYTYGRMDVGIRWRRESVSRGPANAWLYSILANDYLDIGDDVKAEQLTNRALELGPGQFRPRASLVLLHLYRGNREESVQAARHLLDIAPRHSVGLGTLVGQGHFAEAENGYRAWFGASTCNGEPTVTPASLILAIDWSLVLERSGDRICSELLLDGALSVVESWPRLGYQGYGIADARIYARQGKHNEALDALQRAYDEGWRGAWWLTEHDPHLESVRDTPGFTELIQRVRTDAAAQLAQVRQWDANGDLPPIPD